VRIAKRTNSDRLEKLKIKINDQQYLQIAVDRIAVKLSNEIINRGKKQNEFSI